MHVTMAIKQFIVDLEQKTINYWNWCLAKNYNGMPTAAIV
jgi:hypothetical protein